MLAEDREIFEEMSPLKPIADLAAKDGRALTEIVADVIVNALAQGLLQPGQRLIEVELANQLQVSRVPVREAFKILQAQGILKTSQGQGVKVATFETGEIEKVTEVRIALEKIAARDAVAVYKLEPRRIEKLRDIVSKMEGAARWTDWAELRRLDTAFHHEFCRASGNEIVLSLWEALARHITIIFGRELATEQNFEIVIRQHRGLIACFESGDTNIEAEISSHILRLQKTVKANNLNRNAKIQGNP